MLPFLLHSPTLLHLVCIVKFNCNPDSTFRFLAPFMALLCFSHSFVLFSCLLSLSFAYLSFLSFSLSSFLYLTSFYYYHYSFFLSSHLFHFTSPPCPSAVSIPSPLCIFIAYCLSFLHLSFSITPHNYLSHLFSLSLSTYLSPCPQAVLVTMNVCKCARNLELIFTLFVLYELEQVKSACALTLRTAT